MVNITMVTEAAAGGTVYEEGQSYEVSTALAVHFVERGYATSDEELPTSGATAIASSDAGSAEDGVI